MDLAFSLIGELPDAVGLMLFGAMMIAGSVILRRFFGNGQVVEQEIELEETV